MIALFPSNSQIQQVSNFQDFISTPFDGVVNAICWARELEGDFSEIVSKNLFDENMTSLEKEELYDLQLSDQADLARKVIIDDLRLLSERSLAPTLNIIKKYERDDSFPFFPTDVYSWHVDRSPVPASTILCTYYGAASDIVSNADVEQKILIPEIRSELKKLYGGGDEGFEEFLIEHFFDLHYQAKSSAQPTSLGIGHMWRLAIDHPASKVLPCIHRAPIEKNGEPRLMMIC